MANNQALQILRGAKDYNPGQIEEKLLDGQLFYSKYNKQLYIGDNANYQDKPIKEILPVGAANLIATSSSALKQLSATEASGINSVAFGEQTITEGENAVAFGEKTVALAKNGAVFGQYNVASDDALFIIGDGASENDKHNALIITKDTDGNVTDFNFSIKDSGNLEFGGDDYSNVFFKLATSDNANYPLLKIESSIGVTTLRNNIINFYTPQVADTPAIQILDSTDSSPLPKIEFNTSQLIIKTQSSQSVSSSPINLIYSANQSQSELTINSPTDFTEDVTLTESTLTAQNLKATTNITTSNLEAITEITTPNIIVKDTAGNQTTITNSSITVGNNIKINPDDAKGTISAPTISATNLKVIGGQEKGGIDLNLAQAGIPTERPLYVAAAFGQTDVQVSHPAFTVMDQLSFKPATSDTSNDAILKVGGTIKANELCIVDTNQAETTLSGIVSNINGRLDSLGFNCGDVSIIDKLSPITEEKSLTITSPDTAEQITVNPDCYAVKIGKLVGISLKLSTSEYVNNTQIAAAGAAIATLPQGFPIPNNDVTIEAISRVYDSTSSSTSGGTTTNTYYYKSNFTIKQDETAKRIKIYTQELLKIEAGGSGGYGGYSSWSLKPYIILNCWYLSQ